MAYEQVAGSTRSPAKGGHYSDPAAQLSANYSNLAVGEAADAAASAAAAEVSANNAEISRLAAEAAEAAASLVILSGLGYTDSTMYDFGYVSDPLNLFPTDYGTL